LQEIWAQKGDPNTNCYSSTLSDLSIPALDAGDTYSMAVRVLGDPRPEASYYLVDVASAGRIQGARWRITVPK